MVTTVLVRRSLTIPVVVLGGTVNDISWLPFFNVLTVLGPLIPTIAVPLVSA